jgi:hypothetical protein
MTGNDGKKLVYRDLYYLQLPPHVISFLPVNAERNMA